MARVLVPGKPSSSLKAGETINTKIKRRDYLLKQSQLTAEWVQDFRQVWNQEQMNIISTQMSDGYSPTVVNETNMSVPMTAEVTRRSQQHVQIPYALN